MKKFVIILGLIFTPFFLQPPNADAQASEWSMVAGNPERTSWSSEEIKATKVTWYRPIEAYIPQHYQIVAANGLIFVPTAKGLYALNADTGNTAWQFDTELPIGNSPTIEGGVVYVGGFDHKIHALNASNGSHLWSFDGAEKGFNTNPLVVEGKVIAGNRDGYMYAIGAHGASKQGQLIWKYKTGGPILLSAAYSNGVVYFASNDMHAYALNAGSGSLVWKSMKLPGDGFHAYWPVIYKDKVIFPGSSGYRAKTRPGTESICCTGTNDSIQKVEREDVFFDKVYGDLIGPTHTSHESWSIGKTVIDVSRLTNYLEDNPTPHDHLYKPWRRTVFILNQSNGVEVTFDLDNDGYREYAPIGIFGTRSGNIYPPIIAPDGNMYFHNTYKYQSISRARVMGWNMISKYFSVESQEVAIDEPESLSGSGNVLYMSLCCDRIGRRSTITLPYSISTLWHYSDGLPQKAPGYDQMWTLNPIYTATMNRLFANYGNINGIYHNHGYQNPLVPYNGKVYVHRSNGIIALSTSTGPGKKPLLQINDKIDDINVPSRTKLIQVLESEIGKITSAGHLRPGYFNHGNTKYDAVADYFANPGETLYTLSLAYPHLSSTSQQKVKSYLKNEFNSYFYPTMYADIGWKDGEPREDIILPPEADADRSNLPKSTSVPTSKFGYNFIWSYPQFNFYALWKYAEIVPEDAQNAYQQAKTKLEVPAKGGTARFNEYPWEQNAYIAGYIGFLNLQKLAGKDSVDSSLRSQVTNELNKLKALRASNFSTDSPWWGSALIDGSLDGRNTWRNRTHNLSRNFLWLVPEMGDYLNQNAYLKVKDAVNQYNYEGPYWFVSRYEASMQESASQFFHDYAAIYQAKALILKEPYDQLVKYLDISGLARGDLYFIQNIIFSIEAGGTSPTQPPQSPTPSPPPTPGDGNNDGLVDGKDFIIWLIHYGQNVSGNTNGDYDGNGSVGIGDYLVWVNNY